jgi:hypothetical protein
LVTDGGSHHPIQGGVVGCLAGVRSDEGTASLSNNHHHDGGNDIKYKQYDVHVDNRGGDGASVVFTGYDDNGAANVFTDDTAAYRRLIDQLPVDVIIDALLCNPERADDIVRLLGGYLAGDRPDD